VRDGKPDAEVIKALTDESPYRRAGAAVALARAGVKERQEAVRKLLEDRDPLVRLYTGLALVDAQDKEAIPALIRLFAVLPRNRLRELEDIPDQRAGEKAPSAAFATDADARKTFRDAWLGWWKEHGAKIDMSVLQKNTMRDWTLIVMLDEREVYELDN